MLTPQSAPPTNLAQTLQEPLSQDLYGLPEGVCKLLHASRLDQPAHLPVAKIQSLSTTPGAFVCVVTVVLNDKLAHKPIRVAPIS